MNKNNSAASMNRRKSNGIFLKHNILSAISFLKFDCDCFFFVLFSSFIVQDARKAQPGKPEKAERTKKEYPVHPMERRSQSEPDMKNGKKLPQTKSK